MMKLQRSPSHSWWWDSHNSPRHSRWLQSNLQELDEKVKEMLSLIEEDADSFAQRAEMFYQKRPELVNLVEEFYRAYRSLAERYDHLTGEIRQNIPRALQVQYGLSCDSPQAAVPARHRGSPLRKSYQNFESLLKKAAQAEAQAQAQAQEVIDTERSDELKDHPSSQDEGGLSSSDSEVDNVTVVEKLQEELQGLEKENKSLSDSHQKALELNKGLQSRIGELEKKHADAEQETLKLRNRLDELNRPLFVHQMDSSRAAVEDLFRKEFLEEELEESLPCLQDDNDSSTEGDLEDKGCGCVRVKGADVLICGCSAQMESFLKDKLSHLEDQMLVLKEENHRLNAVLRDSAGTNRNATTVIRFLRVGLMGLAKRNKVLEGDVLSAKAMEDTHKKAIEELVRLKEENESLRNEISHGRMVGEQRVSALNRKLEIAQHQLSTLMDENNKFKLAILDRAEEKREAIRQLCFSLDIMKNKNQRLESALGFLKRKLHVSSRASSSQQVPAWKKALLSAFRGPKMQSYALAL